MIGWLTLAEDQRKAVIDEAEQTSGIGANAIEKDWWVTLTLKALFKSAYAKFMVFKGGTSLSKGWDLIARFSEDIDIALDPQAFGMAYTDHPSKTFVERLKRNGCLFTTNQLKQELEAQFLALDVPAGSLSVTAAPIPEKFPDTDPQTLFVSYKSLYDSNLYIPDEVKIEVSVRSAKMPFTQRPLQSLLNKFNPRSVYNETPFEVDIVEPRKTFIEKIFLLHEEFGKPDASKIRSQRMSRHLYDIHKMSVTSILDEVMSNDKLYSDLLQHREWYSRISWVDYQTMQHDSINFIPVQSTLSAYRDDYTSMKEQMIYETDSPSFDEILRNLKILQGRMHVKHESIGFDEIISRAKQQLESPGVSAMQPPVNGDLLTTSVIIPPSEIASDKIISYKLTFTFIDGQLHFEAIGLE